MKRFSFPRLWAVQQDAGRPKIKFLRMLPGCIGFISTDGQLVHYGKHYARLKAEGRID